LRMAEAKDAPTRRRSKEILPSTTVNKETINFKVATEFKRDFKGYAVSQGLTMVELLKEGFVLSKKKRKL
jgi:hypothetical protein